MLYILTTIAEKLLDWFQISLGTSKATALREDLRTCMLLLTSNASALEL